MAGVWADEGIAAVLDVFLGNTTPFGLRLHLYSNNITPDNTTTLGVFDEAAFPGYAPVALGGWSAAAVVAHVASSSAAEASFVITSGTQDIYGWYVTDDTDTILIASQRDPAAPITLDAGAVNTYKVTEVLRDRDEAT